MLRLWVSFLLFLSFLCVSCPMTLEKLPEKTKLPVKRADFRTALKYLLIHEGYWVDNPFDFGQETYCGITKRFNPEWNGWKYVDLYKKTHKLKWNDSIPGLKWYVDFHYLDIFVKEGFYDLQDQDILNQTFDLRVNSNSRGCLVINKTLIEMGYDVPLIGEITENTIKSLNSAPKWEFIARFISNKAQFYSSLVEKRPSQLIFLGHWMKRMSIH